MPPTLTLDAAESAELRARFAAGEAVPFTLHGQVRAADDAATREFTALGVPYGVVIDLYGWGDFLEVFDPGSVRLATDVPPLVLWQHDRKQPVGPILSGTDTAAGFEIVGRCSTTRVAEDAYTLLRDGTITRVSIGFVPVAWRDEVADGITTRHYTEVIAREFSLVSFPAYPTAAVTDVRHQTTATTTTREREPMPENDTAELLRAEVADLSRAIDALRDGAPTLAAAPDTRSAGEVVKALAAGDPDTVRAYEALMAQSRAYTGGTTADAIVKPAWVGDLTRIFDASSGVLADVFSTGPLPETGMSIEYGELVSNTITVGEVAEGDDIPMGKVKVTTKTAPVKTYAGGTQLTRAEIERASVGVLNTHLEALAMAAGVRKKANLRAAYTALLAARTALEDNAGVIALGATLAASTAGHWEDALIEAAVKFEETGLPLETMLTSKSVFKKLRSLTVAGERVFRVAEDNASGVLDLPGLSGEFAGLPVRLDTGQAGDVAAFANSRAIRSRESGLVSLTDENIVNLSKAFAVYRYGAVAAEIPAGVVPVKLTA